MKSKATFLILCLLAAGTGLLQLDSAFGTSCLQRWQQGVAQCHAQFSDPGLLGLCLGQVENEFTACEDSPQDPDPT